ncbi:hypothetical protein [Marinobacterium rhizophilum]|uniref:Uncharacterized protein n=1 Tax=Marinobacterium rhizophilum TaxID=420402 RepID=A0ABY5HGG3_9GAMM|nr:hypothetical protein [Marinobacterium rhizophilum]UTW11461.1 hypothetical protein KDW95_19720 [Marinobacterium rhizophilum]
MNDKTFHQLILQIKQLPPIFDAGSSRCSKWRPSLTEAAQVSNFPIIQ